MDDFFNEHFTASLYVSSGFGIITGAVAALILAQTTVVTSGAATGIGLTIVALGILIGIIVGAATCHRRNESIFLSPTTKL